MSRSMLVSVTIALLPTAARAPTPRGTMPMLTRAGLSQNALEWPPLRAIVEAANVRP